MKIEKERIYLEYEEEKYTRVQKIIIITRIYIYIYYIRLV